MEMPVCPNPPDCFVRADGLIGSYITPVVRGNLVTPLCGAHWALVRVELPRKAGDVLFFIISTQQGSRGERAAPSQSRWGPQGCYVTFQRQRRPKRRLSSLGPSWVSKFSSNPRGF